jgi:aryl-alcohol dehydrogenase-like predicted oxidoreductase
MHLPDNDTPIEESLYAMNDLIRSGKVRYIGISNFASWQISDALAAADKRNIIAPIITQNVYNLLTRSIENELVACTQKHDVSLTVYNPICGGLLTGKHKIAGGPTKNTRFSDDKDYVARYWNEENFRAVAHLTEIAQEAGMPLIELAMRWIASHDFVTSVISGCSRMEQLEQNIHLLANGPLAKDVMATCDEVWKSLAGSHFSYTAQRQN